MLADANFTLAKASELLFIEEQMQRDAEVMKHEKVTTDQIYKVNTYRRIEKDNRGNSKQNNENKIYVKKCNRCVNTFA